MIKYKLKDLVKEISIRVPNPSLSEYEVFVGLEHYESGEVMIRDFGDAKKMESSMKIFEKGDTLVARRNVYLKRASNVDFSGLTSGDTIVLRAKDETITRLLPFVLNTDSFWDYAKKHSDGTMSKRLPPKILLEYEFMLPASKEDKIKLADLLWDIDETRQQYKKLINLGDEAIMSQFSDMFGKENCIKYKWKELPVLNVIEKPIAGEWGSVDKDGTGVNVLRTANFTDEGHIDYSEVVTRNIDLSKKQNKILRYGDILIENSGGSGTKPVGRVVRFIEKNDVYVFNNFTSLLRVKNKDIKSSYLFYFLFTTYWKGGTRKYENKTTGIHNLKTNYYLEKTKIPIPPMELQNQYEEIVYSILKIKSELTDALSKLDEVYKNILNNNLINKEE